MRLGDEREFPWNLPQEFAERLASSRISMEIHRVYSSSVEGSTAQCQDLLNTIPYHQSTLHTYALALSTFEVNHSVSKVCT